MMNNSIDQQHIRYVAAIRQPHGDELSVESFFCCDEEEYLPMERFARYKLKSITEPTSFQSCCFNHFGSWFFKGLRHETVKPGMTYIVVTSCTFPNDIAAECLDEFSELYEKVSKTWLQSRRAQAQTACCEAIATKYSSLEVESAPWILMNQVDPVCRLEYSKSVKKLVDEVKTMQDKMHDNIVKELENMETAERLDALSKDCLEKAIVFRKKARKVRGKQHLATARGVALFATVGGVLGFLAGGPGAALIFASDAVEASIGALVFGVGYWATQQTNTWSWKQKFILL